MSLASFWQSKTVLITGHTGFKGSWLALWLGDLGADVIGFSLAPPTDPSLFVAARVGDGLTSIEGDVRDRGAIANALSEHQPEIVVHLAAQPLVRASVRQPLETFETNVLGTTNVLDACTSTDRVKVVLNVTTDKVYKNDGRRTGYRETDPLGGHDPYSASKACSELVAAAFRSTAPAGLTIATARAGNVIGGGDWSEDRLVPDLYRGASSGRSVPIRHPQATRPWQHVLDCLHGYLRLVERLWDDDMAAGPWNFGPRPDTERTVRWVVERVAERWDAVSWHSEPSHDSVEARALQLDTTKANNELRWFPALDIEEAVEWTVSWYRRFANGDDARSLCEAQLDRFDQLVQSAAA